MNSQEVFAKMKEENKIQEEKLAQKIMEGNENLKKTLQKIKKDMEKISLYSNVNYDSFKNDSKEAEIKEKFNSQYNYNQIIPENSNSQNFYTLNKQSNIPSLNPQDEKFQSTNLNNQNATNMANIGSSTSNFKVQNQKSLQSTIINNNKINTNSVNNQQQKQTNLLRGSACSTNKSNVINESKNNLKDIPNENKNNDMPFSKTVKSLNVRESLDSDKDYNAIEMEKKLFSETQNQPQIPQEQNNEPKTMGNNSLKFYNNRNTDLVNHNNISSSNTNLNNNINNSTGTNLIMSNHNQSNNNTTNDFFHNQDNNSSNYNYNINNNQNNSNNNIQTTSNFYGNNSQSQTGNNFYKSEVDNSNLNREGNSYRNNYYNNPKVNDSSNQYEGSNNPTSQQFYNPNYNSTTKSLQKNDFNDGNYYESVNNRSGSNFNNSINNSQMNKKNIPKKDEHFLSFKKKDIEEEKQKDSSIKPPIKKKNMHNTNKLLAEQREYMKWKNKMNLKENQKNMIQKQNATLSSNKNVETNNSKSKTKTNATNSNLPTENKKKRISFASNEYEEYKIYEAKVLDKLAKEELYADVGSTKDILGEFVDKVIERSLYLYKNRHCHSCARLMSKGKSTYNCPKCHHLLKG